MQSEGLEEESRVYYASALHPKHSQQPMVRRRQSGSASESSHSLNSLSGRHSRSRTDSNGGRGNGGRHHPLTAPQSDYLDSTGITRPHLTRTVNKIDDDMRRYGDNQDGDGTTSRKGEEEREVLMHQITLNDSLAGVSLRYGISLADLRKANHLWANDSIHLRKVLYIPVDKSSRARELARGIKLDSTPLVDLSTSSPNQSSDTVDENGELSEALDHLAGSGLGIQRVPISRMSFFPPPSTSGKTPSISSTPLSLLSADSKPPSQARYLVTPSLSSILTVLPITASTRDDLLARLSFDSASSSFSDRSRPSMEPLEGHELDVVSNHVSGSLDNHETSNVAANGLTSFPHPHIYGSAYHEPASAMNTQTMRGMSRNNQHRHLSITRPAAYIPQISDRTTIRTVQMEPSPMMQLPTLRPRKFHQSIMGGNPSRTNNSNQHDDSASSNLINLG